MRILVVSSHYERPGSITGSHVHGLSKQLNAVDVDVRVLSPIARRLPIGDSVEVNLDGIPVNYRPYWHVPHGLSTRLELRSLAREIGQALDSSAEVDLIHAHRLFPTGAAALKAAVPRGLPVVATAHGSDVHTHPERSYGIRRHSAKLIRDAQAITTVSDSLMRLVRCLGRPANSSRVIANAVDTDLFRPTSRGDVRRLEYGLRPDAVVLLSPGRLVAAKGVFDLLAAFAQATPDRPEAVLVLVGEGPARSAIESEIVRLGIDDRVRLVGSVPHAAMPGWYQAADITVLASHREGLPSVVLESMACGVPVIATDVGGTAEALDSDCGVLVAPRDSAGLSEAIRRVASDRGRRREMGEAGRGVVVARFSQAAAACKYRDLYEEVIGAGGY